MVIENKYQNDIETKGVKQVSSHYSCNSCKKLQDDNGIKNVTGNASDHDNKQKRTLCNSKG